MKNLSAEQEKRFERQILLDDIGTEGQAKIIASKVLVIGLGGLGSPVALYLAAAGVGTLGIADGDKVDLSNLQRQIIHFTGDIDTLKVESAQTKLKAINPAIQLNIYPKFLTPESLAQIAGNYDVVVDATDNLESKLVINQACVQANRPLIHGGIFQYSGEVMTILPGKTACYACLYPNLKPAAPKSSAPIKGPFGPVAGVAGSLQAIECLKVITGVGELLTNQILIIDSHNMRFRRMAVQKRTGCAVCGGLS